MKQKQTHRHREQTCGTEGGGGGGKIDWEFRIQFSSVQSLSHV